MHQRETLFGNPTRGSLADLSGPHPEAVGTTLRYMRVDVFNPGPQQLHLPFARRIITMSATNALKSKRSKSKDEQ